MKKNPPSSLKIFLFNVGQGDHVLLELPNGEFGIIDFFYGGPLNLARPPALDYLEHIRQREPDREIVISFICISHPDQDHVKGVDKFLSWIRDTGIQLRYIWLFAGTRLSELLEYYDEFANSSDSKVGKYRADLVTKNLREVQEFVRDKKWKGRKEYLQDIRQLGRDVGGVRVLSIAPLGDHIRKFDKQGFRDFVSHLNRERTRPTAQKNLVSSVLFMLFKEHKLLFGGDTGEKIWQECLKQYEDIGLIDDHGQCHGNFIKVSHHGSKHSSSLELWTKLLSPKRTYAGISAGTSSYQHPHVETLSHIRLAAKQNRTRVDIFTTNSCDKCLDKQGMPVRSMAWVKTNRPRLHTSVEEVLRQTQPKHRKKQANDNELVAYLFEFQSNNDTRVVRGLTRSVRNGRRLTRTVENRCPTCIG